MTNRNIQKSRHGKLFTMSLERRLATLERRISRDSLFSTNPSELRNLNAYYRELTGRSAEVHRNRPRITVRRTTISSNMESAPRRESNEHLRTVWQAGETLQQTSSLNSQTSTGNTDNSLELTFPLSPLPATLSEQFGFMGLLELESPGPLQPVEYPPTVNLEDDGTMDTWIRTL